MRDLENARLLLQIARKDIDALGGMQCREVFADEIFGFHAQQAVEKSLKAWLAALDREYPLSHNIARLLALLEEEGEDVDACWRLVELNAFAVEFRYGVVNGVDAALDRAGTLADVKSLFERVAALLADLA